MAWKTTFGCGCFCVWNEPIPQDCPGCFASPMDVDHLALGNVTYLYPVMTRWDGTMARLVRRGRGKGKPSA